MNKNDIEIIDLESKAETISKPAQIPQVNPEPLNAQKPKKRGSVTLIILLVLTILVIVGSYFFVEYYSSVSESTSTEESTTVIANEDTIQIFLNNSGIIYFLNYNAKDVNNVDTFINTEYNNEKLMYCYKYLAPSDINEDYSFLGSKLKLVAKDRFDSENVIKLGNIKSYEDDECSIYRYDSSTGKFTQNGECASGASIMNLEIQNFVESINTVDDTIEVIYSTLMQDQYEQVSSLYTPLLKDISYSFCDEFYKSDPTEVETENLYNKCTLNSTTSSDIYNVVKSQLDKYKVTLKADKTTFKVLKYEIVK